MTKLSDFFTLKAVLLNRFLSSQNALFLKLKIRLTLGKAGWFKNYDMQQVIDEMKSIREVKLGGSRKTLFNTYCFSG